MSSSVSSLSEIMGLAGLIGFAALVITFFVILSINTKLGLILIEMRKNNEFLSYLSNAKHSELKDKT